MATARTPRIMILPSPGMGHLIPLAEFSKRLVHRHNFSVTFVIPAGDSYSQALQKSTIDSIPSCDCVFLPPVDFSDLPGDTRAETLISLTMLRSLSSLRDVLKSLVSKTKLVALVVDLFGTDAFDVAKEFDVSPYIFFPTTAMTLSLFLHLPKLDQMVSCEYRDLREPVRIPGCIPIQGKELLDPVQDRENDAYKLILNHTKSGAIKALLDQTEPDNPPVYLVGPLTNVGSTSSHVDGSELDCLKWLDDQPHGSVLYVSFGSGGTLSSNQLTELAMGLEMSEQRFLWVIRSPNDMVANANFFSVQSQKEPCAFLPKGFLDRTKGRGLVVPSWAPQAQVLSHGSTGGFLTHCGWNSILESVVTGLPLIAWPLYAEQKMNATMLTEDIGVALRPRRNENGLIPRDEIARAVQVLMEAEQGKDIRRKIKHLKEAAANTLSENGCSTKALSDVATKWRNQATQLDPLLS
ncbi:hypothetical protein V6N13_003074 [Hibiscus sabdariffa]|uniref:Glycosyltransferase n=1 Tax=Hibiscus sabdariffa TaxID=183260 RepID=A0ABR2NDJ3_9ROSI